MAPLLYLDTARLGQMTPAAKDAQLDFVRFSAEEPSSLYFEEFLRDGFSAWPSHYQERFPGLRTWTGVAGLKHSIRQLVDAPDDWQVLLASRSLALVQFASTCMFRVCRNVLATDLSWPTYEQAIEAKARLTGNRITTVPLRDEILKRGWTVDDVATYLANAFIEHQCDGLFLPAVDHLGIRLPLRNVVEQIRERSELRFCFIDAAQALCHVPLDDCLAVADFIVAGSHKWMGAYLPTGIGLFGQRRSRTMIEYRVRHPGQTGYSDDPLLHFTEQIDAGGLDGHSETANLTPMFACSAAASIRPKTLDNWIGSNLLVDESISRLICPKGQWKPLRPAAEFRSRIALLERIDTAFPWTEPDDVRRAWLAVGTIVSGVSSNMVRLSFPFPARLR